MLLTEAEAKKKTCLQTLTPVSMAPEFPVYNSSCCIASECMAWRFGPDLLRSAQHRHKEAIEAWELANEIPANVSDEEWDRLVGEREEKARKFASELVAADSPDDSGAWEWRSGYDEEEGRIYSYWYHKGMKRGWCGLARRPE